jgi:hypothetical protein
MWLDGGATFGDPANGLNLVDWNTGRLPGV